VSKANKRERQRQNRELAKVERERLIKRDRRLRALRGLLFVLVPVAVIFVIISIVRNDDGDSPSSSSATCREVPDSYKPPKKDTSQQAPPLTIDPAKTYTATIKTSCGTMTTTLDASTAPTATNNFVFLAREGFYNGLCVERAAEKFVIQGGSPKCDQQGGPGYTVTGEVPTNNYPVGSLAAAKGPNEPAGSFGSSFFIVTGPGGKSLPNEYARFGQVTKGMAVAKDLESLAPEPAEGAQIGDGPPTQKVVIDKITVAES
jgi:cyclophilin family peptidyl-prolyl cis-trans isomerase